MNNNTLSPSDQIINELNSLVNGYDKLKELGITLDSKKIFKQVEYILKRER